MKATYIKPAIEVMEGETDELLAASLLTTNQEGNLIQDLGNAPTTTESSGNLSRKSIWDDDEY